MHIAELFLELCEIMIELIDFVIVVRLTGWSLYLEFRALCASQVVRDCFTRRTNKSAKRAKTSHKVKQKPVWVGDRNIHRISELFHLLYFFLINASKQSEAMSPTFKCNLKECIKESILYSSNQKSLQNQVFKVTWIAFFIKILDVKMFS